MVLKIKKGNDPILRQETEKITQFDFEFQKLVDDLIDTMRKANGVGLAAPQIGSGKKLFVCEFTGEKEGDIKPFPLTVLCNPEIVSCSKTKRQMVEGCLSFPGIEILVKRPRNVTIKGQDRYGKNIEIQADGLFSRVLQHETDHLNSTLFIDHIKETPIFFIGTGTLGAESLKALINDPQYSIKAVVTGFVEAQSRNHKEKNINVIEEIARSAKIPIIKTDNINTPENIEFLKKTKAKLGIMADFGQMIKSEILSIPRYGIINIHPSLLPRHRGPSPVQQTILDGDRLSGVSLILTVNKMDAGPIISQISIKLSKSETSTILKDYLGKLAASLLLNSLPYYLAGDLKPIEQNEKTATYTHLFKKEDGFVDENTTMIELDRKIRAFDSWPKVFTKINDKLIQITAGHFAEDGSFEIDRVKPEGRNEMNYSDFINGYRTTLTFKR